MGWIYILIRTFPFWAIPVGMAFIAAAIRTKKGSTKKKVFFIFLGILLNAFSVYFLINEGHMEAVPFVHQIIHGQR